MGEFLFHSRNTEINRAGMLDSFSRRGFGGPMCFDLGDVQLFLFPKQRIQVGNWTEDGRGNRLFATGTPVYKGRDYSSGLIELLQDWDGDTVEVDRLRGSYCLLFCGNRGLELWLDPTGLYPVFVDPEAGVVCSSLIGLLHARTSPARLNHEALLGRVLTASVVGPETLFREIRLLEPGINAKWPGGLVIRATSRAQAEVKFSSRAEALERISDCLSRYIEDISSLSGSCGSDQGLSGGYDSRLLFAMAAGLPGKLQVHSHLADATHRINVEAAKRIAATRDLEVRIHATTQPGEMNAEQIEQSLDDAVNFFDGCSNRNMGHYNEVHTRAYRIRVLGEIGLGLNGMNGEVLRNHYFITRDGIRALDWLLFEQAYPGVWLAFRGRAERSRFFERWLEQFQVLLGPFERGRIRFEQIRGYVREYRTRYYCAWKNKAEQRLSFFLMPFMDGGLLELSRGLNRGILGLTGEFERDLIAKFDPKIVSIPSHYGFPLDHEPFRHRLHARLRNRLPYRYFLYNRDVIHGPRTAQQRPRETMLGKSAVLRDALRTIEDLLPELEGEKLFWYHQTLANAIAIGYFLNVHSSCWTV